MSARESNRALPPAAQRKPRCKARIDEAEFPRTPTNPRREAARPSRKAKRCEGVGGPGRELRGRSLPPVYCAEDRGDGRGLNPPPDERRPATRSMGARLGKSQRAHNSYPGALQLRLSECR